MQKLVSYIEIEIIKLGNFNILNKNKKISLGKKLEHDHSAMLDRKSHLENHEMRQKKRKETITKSQAVFVSSNFEEIDNGNIQKFYLIHKTS